MTTIFKRFPWATSVVLLIVILVIGMTLTVIGTAHSHAARDAFWSDLAKAGLQLTVITSLGLVVTVTLRQVDERRRRDEQRMQIFRDIIGAYNRVKSVRRTLRALGLLAPTDPLNAHQAQGLRDQMSALNEAQLSLEAMKRELEESRLFKERDAVVALGTAERYLGEIVYRRWERIGGRIWEGADAQVVCKLELVKFAGHKSLAFRDNVSQPLDKLTRLLHAELFGPPRHNPRTRSDRTTTKAG